MITECIPSIWRRRCRANGVWLWRRRFRAFSWGKTSFDMKKIGRSQSSLDLPAEVDELVEEVRADGEMVLRGQAVPARELDVADEVPLGLLPEVLELARPLEAGRVDDPDRQEDAVLEVAREVALDVQERVHPEAVEAGDEKDGRRRPAFRRLDLRERAGVARLRRTEGRQDVVRPLQQQPERAVVPPHEDAEPHDGTRDQDRHPPSRAELHHHGGRQERGREREAEAVDREVALPGRVLTPHLPPVDAHAELREAEGEEDVDRVHDRRSRRSSRPCREGSRSRLPP